MTVYIDIIKTIKILKYVFFKTINIDGIRMHAKLLLIYKLIFEHYFVL